MADTKVPFKTIEPGTVIFRKGDKPDFAYVVMKGEVEISVLKDGQRVVLVHVGPQQIFGEMALLENHPRSATATTTGGCQVVAIDKAQLDAKIAALDPFIRYWILYLTDRVRDLSTRTLGKRFVT